MPFSKLKPALNLFLNFLVLNFLVLLKKKKNYQVIRPGV